MKIRYFISAIAVLCAVQFASAQNMNPVVQVTNDYKTRMADFQKQGVEMQVPDTLTQFGYKFDYSVFDRDYKGGSYEFSPYRVAVAPDAPTDGMSRLYLRLGAGWTLHPELELAWTPVAKDNFSFDVFSKGNGYYGAWKGLDVNGYDFNNDSGVNLKWTGSRNEMRLSGGYTGIFTSASNTSLYNSAWAHFGASSTPGSERVFIYDASLDYRFGNDNYAGTNAGEHNVAARASLGGKIVDKYKVTVDLDASVAAEKSLFFCSGVAPRFEMILGNARFDLGARLSYSDALRVFPKVNISYGFVPVHLTIYASCTGGEELNSYWRIKNFNHALTSVSPDFSFETVNAKLGIRGRIAKRFQYDLNAGWASRENALMDAVLPVNEAPGFVETVCFQNYNQFYVKTLMAWYSERFDADMELGYSRTWLPEDVVEGALDLPAFTGSVKAVYNWNKRIYAGLNCSAQTARKSLCGLDYSVPGWVDLGLTAEYRFASRWSVWVKGGNLLGQEVRLSPLRAAASPYFTAGFCLVL